MVLLAYLAIGPTWGESCQPALYHLLDMLMYLGGSVVILVFAIFFAYVSRGAIDVITKRSQCYAFFSAAFLLIMAIQVVIMDAWHECPGVLVVKVFMVAFDALPQIAFPLLVVCFCGLVEERVRLTEVGFSDDLGSRSIWRLRFAYIALELAGTLTYFSALGVGMHVAAGGETNLPWMRVVFWLRLMIHNFATSLCYLSVGFIAFRCFTSVRRSMDAKASSVASYVNREKRWAQTVMEYLRWTTILQCGFSALLHLALVAMYLVAVYFSEALVTVTQIVYSSVQTLMFLMELIVVLTVTGLIRPQHSSAFQSARQSPSTPSSSSVCRTPAWESKVKELAGRCLSVGTLLDFYELLATPDGPMPQYQPELSTTNDVVRQAIIPLTRTPSGGGSSFAALHCSDGASCLPQVMVTHTWTARFLDIVACVASEACGLDEYDGTAIELSEDGCQRLRQVLEKKGVLGRTYWICAFCVNQHAGICGGLGLPPPASSQQYVRWDHDRRDSVTGEVFTVCNCSQPKCLNDSSPEECEMNKFDDMMEHLSREVGDFAQLVCVDREYAVFTRAWCVAELHKARAMGMEQKVCMHTNRVLDVDAGDLGVYKKLAMLTVTACEASRPQDKEEILSRIPNTEEFDAQLQEVIFGNRGLLRRNFEGLGLLEAAARTAFRVNRAQSCAVGHL